MVGKRSNRCVVAFLVCAICWTVAWPASCFRSQRHFGSSRHSAKTCRHAENTARQGATALPELPLGVDDFDQLRLGEPACAYVDKTSFLPSLVVYRRQHFLARPRRFGKSLLVDTIRCIFMENGPQKDKMFEGLDITKSEAGQKLLKMELPVVHLKLHLCEATEGKETLMADINRLLINEAQRNGVFGVLPLERRVGATLQEVIQAIRSKHNQKRVVFLVDEYDSPITQVLETNGGGVDERVKNNLEVLRSLYTTCKGIASRNFHYSFYTGVSRFASTSMFSGSNQLDDVSFSPQVASIVGFTESEVETYFAEYVSLLATGNASLAELAQLYGGHRFAYPAEELLNPWSLLNRFKQEGRGEAPMDQWRTQTPRWASKMLDEKKIPEVLKALATWKPLADFVSISVDSFEQLSIGDRIALLQQTGYLSIREMKDMDSDPQVRLLVPNREVQNDFWRKTLNPANVSEGNEVLNELFKAIRSSTLEDVTVVIDKMNKLSPWATLTVKAPELQQLISEFFNRLR